MSDTKPTDADVETLRRAMVEAHATREALSAAVNVGTVGSGDMIEPMFDEFNASCVTFDAAARAYVAAKRARGAL